MITKNRILFHQDGTFLEAYSIINGFMRMSLAMKLNDGAPVK